MEKVKIDRLALLGIVRENLVKHLSEYEEAVVDYKVLVVKVAKDNAKIAKFNVKKATEFKLREMKSNLGTPIAPSEYSKEYGRAIRMLELSVDSNIELEEDIFNQLVMDEWSWKHNFSASNSMVKSMAYGAVGSIH